MRSSVALIYVAIVVIAASTAAIVYRVTGLSLDIAILFGMVIFFALAIIDQVVARREDRKAFQQQLDLSDHALQDAFNEIDMIRSRLVSLETDTQQTVDAGVAPVQQDLKAVGALLSQVTEAVSDNDHRLVTLEGQLETLAKAQTARAKKRKPAAQPLEPKIGNETPLIGDHQSPQKGGNPPDDTSKALLQRVRTAVEKERYEIALQSIVTLPQRRSRGYAVQGHLVLDGVGTLEEQNALPAIEATQLSEPYARAVVLRALALADKFHARESASIVFMPVTGSAIVQTSFADWLVTVLGQVSHLAGRLVIELTQKDVRSLSPIDFDLLMTLSEMGFRASVSRVDEAMPDLFDLTRYGFRYAKAPAGLFLSDNKTIKSDIHPADLSDLAARNGMDMIVSDVESEAQVVELLALNLNYGQGNLFARPRVVDINPLVIDPIAPAAPTAEAVTGSGVSQDQSDAPAALRKSA